MRIKINFIYWFRRNFICTTIFGNGHVAESYFNETFFSIYTKRCKNCHSTLGFGEWKYMPYPPNSTEKQIKSFDEYRLKKLEEIRNSFNPNKNRLEKLRKIIK